MSTLRHVACWPVVCLVGGLLFLVTGCEDAANVGGGLAPEDGSSPTRVTVRANDVQQTEFTSVSGNRDNVLVGAVSDPLFGSITATGYLDLGLPGSFPDSFEDEENEFTSVVFKLKQDYLYGDTTGTVELVLHGMDEDWPASRRTVDTTLTAGTEIARVQVNPSDTLHEIPMPDSWIEENADGLRGLNTNFTSEFHGFRLSSPDANVIQGINSDSTRLQVIIAEDTVNFSISKELATAARTEAPQSMEDRAPLQTGVGPAVSLKLPLNADSLGNAVMNRIRLTLPIDMETMESQKPLDFARPLPRQLIIYGVNADGDRTPLYTGAPDRENEQYVFDSPQLTGAFQQVLLGKADYERYIIAGSTANRVTLSPVLFYGSEGETHAPSAALTIVPVD